MRLIALSFILLLITACAPRQGIMSNLDEDQVAVYVNHNKKSLSVFVPQEHNLNITVFNLGRGNNKAESIATSLFADIIIDSFQNDLNGRLAKKKIKSLHKLVHQGDIQAIINQSFDSLNVMEVSRIEYQSHFGKARIKEAVGNYVITIDTEFGFSADYKTPMILVDMEMFQKSKTKKNDNRVLKRTFFVAGKRISNPTMSIEEAKQAISELDSEYKKLSKYEKIKQNAKYRSKRNRLKQLNYTSTEQQELVIEYWSQDDLSRVKKEYSVMMNEVVELIETSAKNSFELEQQLQAGN